MFSTHINSAHLCAFFICLFLVESCASLARELNTQYTSTVDVFVNPFPSIEYKTNDFKETNTLHFN